MRTVLAVVALALLIAVPAVAKKPVPEPPASVPTLTALVQSSDGTPISWCSRSVPALLA